MWFVGAVLDCVGFAFFLSAPIACYMHRNVYTRCGTNALCSPMRAPPLLLFLSFLARVFVPLRGRLRRDAGLPAATFALGRRGTTRGTPKSSVPPPTLHLQSRDPEEEGKKTTTSCRRWE
ncbi:hypothetical protein MRX96_028125 [Rhipicephalus microplus]